MVRLAWFPLPDSGSHGNPNGRMEMRRTTKAIAIALIAASAWARAAAPDTEAVEFYNTTLGHYFVTTSASEALGIDAGAAGAGWVRTGRSFQAWTTKSAAPADAQAVCRFYSSGANSHFYTASPDECLQLRGMEAADRAQTGGTQGWSYEGTAFFIQVPQSGQCSSGTTKLTRVYNNGFANGEGANHRFVDDAELQAMMVDQQWITEGAAFCAESKRTGTDADLPPTTTNFDAIGGTWTGGATWKAESADTETHATHDLSLTIAADGSVTGTGNGCAFTGQVTAGDGFRSFFRGTATATGCTDAAFTGAYPKLRLQRFGAATLLVRFQREDEAADASAMQNDNEVSIQANLTNGATPTPTPAPPPSPGIAGDWAGTVAWLAVQHMASGNIFERASANQALMLSISAAGAVTGSGFGCTVTGTLAMLPKKDGGDGDEQEGPDDNSHGGSGGSSGDGSQGSGAGGNPASGAGAFGGTITLAGCDQPLFDGTFTGARARPAGAAHLVIDFERTASDASGSTRVEIAGVLQAAATTP
jgi:hypothetical protein